MNSEVVSIKPRFGLNWLIGDEELESFMNKIWSKEILFINRDNPDYYSDLIRLEDINRLINSKHFTSIDMVRDNQILMPNVYDNGSNKESIFEWYKNGATIIIDNLEKNSTNALEMCESLSREIPYVHRVIANLYFTPSSSQAFNLHSDWQDVFIIQLEGKKRWEVYKPDYKYPTTEAQSDLFMNSEYDLIFDQTLLPGNLLYVPRGFPHKVITEEEFSIHITLSIIPYNNLDLVKIFFEDKSDQSEDLRRTLEESTDLKVLRDSLISIISDESTIKKMDQIAERLAFENRRVYIPDYFSFEKSNQINEDSILQKTDMEPDLRFVKNLCFIPLGEDEFQIEDANELIEYILRQSSDYVFAIKNFPFDYEIDSKIDLMKLLIQNGLLRIVSL
jgi:ribosomal protein L16 Arg81 hydroxylase